jgi:hypothetical protein
VWKKPGHRDVKSNFKQDPNAEKSNHCLLHGGKSSDWLASLEYGSIRMLVDKTVISLSRQVGYL